MQFYLAWKRDDRLYKMNIYLSLDASKLSLQLEENHRESLCTLANADWGRKSRILHQVFCKPSWQRLFWFHEALLGHNVGMGVMLFQYEIWSRTLPLVDWVWEVRLWSFLGHLILHDGWLRRFVYSWMNERRIGNLLVNNCAFAKRSTKTIGKPRHRFVKCQRSH